jgi:RHS repeat-associated protein
LVAFARGTLNGSHDTISSPSHSITWSLDALGNFSSTTTDGGSPVSNSFNKQNEETAAGSSNLAYDSNGNLTTDDQGHTLVWDAWNRLVAVKNGGTTLVSYKYDALGRKIVENPGTTSDLYSSTAWQVLEERSGGVSTATVQYVWSPVYVDALVARDRSTQNNGTMDERLYAQQDANWNVVALLSTSGAVVERYVYDPYGKPTFLNASWGTLSGSAYASRYLHQGGRYDTTSGLYTFDRRPESPTLGRWVQIDPLGLGAGDVNLYRTVGDDPLTRTDPSGLIVSSDSRPTFSPPPHADWSNLGGNEIDIRVATDGLRAGAGGVNSFQRLREQAAAGSGSNLAEFWAAVDQINEHEQELFDHQLEYRAEALSGSDVEETGGWLETLRAMFTLPNDPNLHWGVVLVPGPFTSPAGAFGAAEAEMGAVGASRGGSCFPAGTQVHTAAGLKAIEEIVVGDRVWSYDHKQLGWAEREVVEVYQLLHQGTMATVQVKGETLRATGGHPFWVVRGEGLAERPAPRRISAYQAGSRQEGRWVLGRDLRAGDEVLLRAGEVVALESVRLDEVEERVYNFHVAELQNYAVGGCGVLVHNTNDPGTRSITPPERAELTRLQSLAQRTQALNREITRLNLELNAETDGSVKYTINEAIIKAGVELEQVDNELSALRAWFVEW